MAIISLCVHCGEKMKGDKKYCRFCDTAEKRKRVDKENAKIQKENQTKAA